MTKERRITVQMVLEKETSGGKPFRSVKSADGTWFSVFDGRIIVKKGGVYNILYEVRNVGGREFANIVRADEVRDGTKVVRGEEEEPNVLNKTLDVNTYVLTPAQMVGALQEAARLLKAFCDQNGIDRLPVKHE